MRCNNCGNEVSDGVSFCGNCGNEILNTLVSETPNSLGKNSGEKKTKNKLLYILAVVLVVALIAIFFLLYSKIIKPRMAFNRLPEISTIESQINRSLNAICGTNYEYDVSGFEISDAEDKNYDKTFRCEAMNGNVIIVGQAKEDHVIQMQTIIFADVSDPDFSEDMVASMMGLSIFQLALFDDDVNDLSDYNRVKANLEEIENGGNDNYTTRYVKGDIETAVGVSVTENTMVILGNVRYLPEYGMGFFDED